MNEYDSKEGRTPRKIPVAYRRGGNAQPYYCHDFQHDECDLPCSNHVHEYIPMDLKQESLRRQGFKGVTLIVFPLVCINTIDKPTLMVSFSKYEQIEKYMIQKIRVYVDGNGGGWCATNLWSCRSQMNELQVKSFLLQ